MAGMPSGRIPIFIVTGFLGAGKTSLIDKMLRDPRMESSAVIVNEYSEIGLDHLVIGRRGNRVVELPNGCLCCSVRGEFVDALLELPTSAPKRIIVETSGMAEPGGLLAALIADERLARRFRAGSVTTLIDVRHGCNWLDRHSEARAQVKFADRILITRMDEIPSFLREDHAARLATKLRALNGHASIDLRDRLASPAELLLSERAGELHQAQEIPGHSREESEGRIVSVPLVCERAVTMQALQEFCAMAERLFGADLLRLKGLAALPGTGGPASVHAVHGLFDEPEILDAWPDGSRDTRLVAILRNSDPQKMRDLFRSFFGDPAHDLPDREALTANPLAIPGMRL